MAKGRKSSITSEDRNRWLDDLEKGTGKGITQIATTAGRDIRTVKKHIETARSEREFGRVRHDFLLSRIELHNEDLLGDVRRQKDVLVPSKQQSLAPTDGHRKLVHQAFVEHIKRLSVFSLMARWEDAVIENKVLREKHTRDLESEERRLVKGLPGNSLSEWTPKVASDREEMLEFGKTNEFDYTEEQESPEGTKIQISRGSVRLTRKYLEKSKRDSIVKAYEELRSFAIEQAVELRPLYSELASLAFKITDELEVFLMRRFVPGKCQYCPF